MRKHLIVMLGALLCLALAAPVVAASSPAREDVGFQADAVSGASPNYRVFTEAELKAMKKHVQTLDGGGDIVSISEGLAGGHYTCQKNSDPYTYFEQDWKGVSLSYLLEQEVGLKPDTTGIKVIADDGYAVTLTLDQMRQNGNPRGLDTILAWQKGKPSADNPHAPDATGAPWVAPLPTDQVLDESEGPFRLVMPQKVEGPDPRNVAYSPAGTGDANWNKAVQRVRAIEVQPVPPGIPSIDPAAIPPSEIVVYGNILNRKTLTVDQLKSIAPVTADYPWKNKAAETGVDACAGIHMDCLLDQVVGLGDVATQVELLAADGWGFKDRWTLDQIRDTYGPDGDLKFMLAWNRNGEDLGPEPDGDGPIQMIKPQFDPDDTNTSKWLKWVRTVQVDDGDEANDDPAPDPTQIPTDRAIFWGDIDAGNVPSEWFFAEGCTGFGFEAWLSIANPNSWESKVIVDYHIEGEAPQQQTLTVPARTRHTINVAAVIGEGKNFSARVEGYHGDSIVAERAMYWSGKTGGHCASGVNAPEERWYLAEGCTAGGFETWVLLQNPGSEDATVNLTYLTDTGEVKGSPVLVPAMSRRTVNIATDGVADRWDVSTMVKSDHPIVAERAVYWNNRRGGHCEMGVTSPASRWYLAEGATAGGFETWVLVQNPNDNEVRVDLAFMTGSGPVAPPELQDYVIAARSRHSFNINAFVTDYDVSTMVTSEGGGVIAERALYWNDKSGGHDAHGVERARFKAFLAEGATAGGFETWVLLQNPGPSDATIHITYQTLEGAIEEEPMTLEAGKRASVNVGAEIGETYDASILIRSSAPVVAERAVYWDSKIEGTCSTGYASW
ncbi:MAG: hypothetical protein H5T74_08560 [Actinobacteria bacterium]|nr:hypothetical protein [Actinomycetota bacterium]